MQDYTFAAIVFVITVVVSGLGLLLYNYLVRMKNKRTAAIKVQEENRK